MTFQSKDTVFDSAAISGQIRCHLCNHPITSSQPIVIYGFGPQHRPNLNLSFTHKVCPTQNKLAK